MFVKSLEVASFRNYIRQSLELSHGVNVFTGGNGMGKTNLLEAVCVCSIGKSPRTNRERELIMWEMPSARIKLTTQKQAGEEAVEIVISKTENKRVAVNGMPISRIGELMGVVPTVFFSPGELKIVQSSPGERRSFVDIALCQLSRTYFYLLTRYNKVLAQRNKLLKSGKATDDALDIWDAQLAAYGAKVIRTRKGFVENLAPFARENHLFLSDQSEELTIAYEGIDGESGEETEAEFLRLLKKDRVQDLKVGFTHVGPHKDDLSLKIGGVDIRTYGSQGQQRTSALALKLSELALAEKTRGECPVLLLDDVLSELDLTRQKKLLSRIGGFQTLITCTHLDAATRSALPSAFREFVIQKGSILQ